MVDNVIELTTSRLTDPVLADMAGILGIEESRACKAVEQSAAVIVAGMLRASATLAGSESLLETLARSRGNLGLSRDLESVLASRESARQLQQTGRELIRSIFGDRLGAVLLLIGGLLSLSRESAATLLGLVAPLVVAQLEEFRDACGREPGRLLELIQDQSAYLRVSAPAGLPTALGLRNLASLSDHAPQVFSNRTGDPPPPAPPDAESHIAADPAIELGTRLANWLVPVVLAVLGFSALYGLRAGPAAGLYDTVQPAPVAGQQPPTRSKIAIGRDPLLSATSRLPGR